MSGKFAYEIRRKVPYKKCMEIVKTIPVTASTDEVVYDDAWEEAHGMSVGTSLRVELILTEKIKDGKRCYLMNVWNYK